jgi:glycosyltransferase involved in cell wall biosynthesis
MIAPRRPRVIYWQNIPSPYFVGRFNALADRGNLDFEAWFNGEREPDRSWAVRPAEWRFRARYIPGRPVWGQTLHLPIAELRQVRPEVFVSLYDRASFAFGSVAARAVASRTAYRTLPNFETWAPRSWWRELGKHILFRGIDGALVPGPDGRALAVRYGLPCWRTHTMTQSIDVEHFGRARAVSAAQRERERLGLHGCVFIYVGRLWKGKGLDHLFAAYRLLRAERPDVSLLLVGDGVDEARYRQMASELPHVAFAGFIEQQDIPDYYALADAFVFPTLGDPHGLVVDEAMAAGLPVICTDAAGDIRQRLPDGEAGFIVPAADPQALARGMIELAADSACRARFSAECVRLVAPRVHARWALDFEAFVARTQSQPRRGTPAASAARLAGRLLLATAEGRPRSPAPYLE